MHINVHQMLKMFHYMISRKTGIRVCLTFLLLMFYTLTIGYRGTLTSLLTVKINPKVFKPKD